MDSSHSKPPVRVWIDGCFDLMHYGHANSLRQAKAMGDVLVVGVHSDKEIKAYKGPPVFTEQERYRMVRGIKWVDEVVEGSPYWPLVSTLDQYKCNFATHGDDIPLANDGRDPLGPFKEAGRIKIFQRTQGISTTDIIGRMLLKTQPDRLAKNYLESMLPQNSSFLQTSRKIAEFAEANGPKRGDRIVYVSGTWDLLHPGHLEFLEAARKEGDYLIVGVHSDRQESAPILNLDERTLCLLACKYVSEVVIGAPLVVSEDLMSQMNIDLVCHGWTEIVVDKTFGDPFSIPKKMKKFKIIETGNRLTTSTVLQRIIERRPEFTLRNAKKTQLDHSI